MKANNGTITIDRKADVNSVYLYVTAGSTEWPVDVSIAKAAIGAQEIETANVPEGYEVQLIDGIYSVCGVDYVAQIGETKYATVVEALAAAKSGETVLMVADSTEGTIIIPVGVTLDLNGQTLTVTSMFVKFGDLIDGDGTTAAGTLRMADTVNAMWGNVNEQIPIKTANGYKFAGVVKMNVKYKPEENKYIFQPIFSAAGNKLLDEGEAETGVSIEIHVDWLKAATTETEGAASTGTQTFVFNQTTVNTFIDNYDPETGKNRKQISLTLKVGEGIEVTGVYGVVASTTGVKFQNAIFPPVTE